MTTKPPNYPMSYLPDLRILKTNPTKEVKPGAISIGIPVDFPNAIKSYILLSQNSGDVRNICSTILSYCLSETAACPPNDPDFWQPVSEAMKIPVPKSVTVEWRDWVRLWCRRFAYPFMNTPKDELNQCIDWIINVTRESASLDKTVTD